MNKRRMLSLSLALTLLFALASCGNKDDGGSPAPSDSSSVSDTPAPSDSQSPAPSDSQSPAPSDSQSPEPSGSQSPEPSDSQSPERPIDDSEPGSSGSGPVDDSESGSSGSTVDLQKFYADLLTKYEADYFAPDVLVEGELLDSYYPGLKDISTKQLLIYQPMRSAVACEIALAEVEKEEDVQKVKDIFQARIDYQVGTDDTPGGAWYPESIESWKNNSRVVSNGNYVMMIAWDGCDQFVEEFNALF